MRYIAPSIIAGYIALLIVAACFGGCEPSASDHSQTTSCELEDSLFNKLKSPVVLIGKDKTLGMWGITVKDSTGYVLSIGDLCSIANNIGASRNIGDTLK